MSEHASLESMVFDNRFTAALPGDPETANFTRQVQGVCYSPVSPTPVASPKLVAWSREVAQDLGLNEQQVKSGDFVDVFSGNRALAGMEPFAMCYGGHQFGNWAGQLGDGRAIGLGDVVGPGGESFALQLKGAGMTPYSRTADGLAVLRSSIREFLCSEAMHHLGVPTTRALSLMTTGEDVTRDILYSGDPRPEPGAVVCRVAPSFVRFGNFEIHAARQELDLLRTLADFTIENFFPAQAMASGPDRYVAWFREISERTARLMADWMAVGFVHGVMNTDNMSILGLTIDYGPYGWLEDYDPDWTPNTTDAAGKRYRYSYQPRIGQWNLLQLANAIYPLIEDAAPLEAVLNDYTRVYEEAYQARMAAKLGLSSVVPGDDVMVAELFTILGLVETDMAIFFRQLNAAASDNDVSKLSAAWYRPEERDAGYDKRLGIWLQRYRQRLETESRDITQVAEQMRLANPRFVMRNYLAQLAIDKAEAGDISMVDELLDTMRRPFDDQPGRETFAEKRPDWARTRPGCSMLSCSS